MRKLLPILLVVGACKHAPGRVAGKGFTVQIPDGFTEAPAAMRRQVGDHGGVAVVEAKRPGKGAPGSIIVEPLDPPADPSTDAGCAAYAQKIAVMQSFKVARAAVTDLPTGRNCQAELADAGGSTRASTISVVASTAASWVVTCNRDAADDGAAKACAAFLDGWRWSQ